jgi:hypothetical protein
VTLYGAGSAAPTKLGEGKMDGQGAFKLDVGQAPAESVLYLIAEGGTRKVAASKGANDAIALLALLGKKPPKHVVVNEFTTVASAFTAARFIQGESISGNQLGLRIAAGNVPNFVNLETGSWGKVIIDPYNSYKSATLAKFDTLASLVTYASRRPAPTGASASSLRRRPAAARRRRTHAKRWPASRANRSHPKELYGLFEEAYPQPKEDSRRSAPFAPYLSYEPPDFALLLWFAGGRIDAPGVWHST